MPKTQQILVMFPFICCFFLFDLIFLRIRASTFYVLCVFYVNLSPLSDIIINRPNHNDVKFIVCTLTMPKDMDIFCICQQFFFLSNLLHLLLRKKNQYLVILYILTINIPSILELVW